MREGGGTRGGSESPFFLLTRLFLPHSEHSTLDSAKNKTGLGTECCSRKLDVEVHRWRWGGIAGRQVVSAWSWCPAPRGRLAQKPSVAA